MKVIIAGSRHFTDLSNEYMDSIIKSSNLEISEVVCGCAKGIDMAGEYWADLKIIPVKHFHAEWEKYGASAGPIRNRKMAQYADALILIWDGKSKGSKNMKQEMLSLNKPIYELIISSYDKK